MRIIDWISDVCSSDLNSYGPALIDDNTPIPSHALFRWSGSLRVAAMGCLLWLIPMAFLLGTYGWDHTLTQMGWFFTKAALLTFGGAYAVLPYIYQGAVGHYSWLRSEEHTSELQSLMRISYAVFCL